MMFVLFVVTLFWVAPLAIASLISLVATLSPSVRASVRRHLFGEDAARAEAEIPAGVLAHRRR